MLERRGCIWVCSKTRASETENFWPMKRVRFFVPVSYHRRGAFHTSRKTLLFHTLRRVTVSYLRPDVCVIPFAKNIAQQSTCCCLSCGGCSGVVIVLVDLIVVAAVVAVVVVVVVVVDVVVVVVVLFVVCCLLLWLLLLLLLVQPLGAGL